MFERAKIQSHHIAINPTGAVVTEFYLPRASRIKRYFSVPSVAQAAHATIVVKVEFVNAGVNGSGSTLLATLTNDSDLADSTKRKSSAWVAHVPKEINTENRPGSPTWAENEADEMPAGTVIKVTVTGEGTTPSASNHIVGIEYVESD